MHLPAPLAFALGPATQPTCQDDPFNPETVDYDSILQIILFILNCLDLYAQGLRQPLSVWDGTLAGTLALDKDMQEELGGAFREPSVSSKHVNSASTFRRVLSTFQGSQS